MPLHRTPWVRLESYPETSFGNRSNNFRLLTSAATIQAKFASENSHPALPRGARDKWGECPTALLHVH
jgi:hypothetical protein